MVNPKTGFSPGVFVSGHDFSRAEDDFKFCHSERALAREESAVLSFFTSLFTRAACRVKSFVIRQFFNSSICKSKT
jgi:hypothetical protein